MKSSLAEKYAPTPYFIEFLYELYFGRHGAATEWHDQQKESLVDRGEWLKKVNAVYYQKLLSLPKAVSAINTSHELRQAIVAGSAARLVPYQARYKFIAVVGAPRSGGSYLTKTLFTALGMDVDRISATLAHDGFPELSPFFFADGHNVHTIMASRMAEYLVMVSLFFAKAKAVDSRVVVPKKASKAAYQGAFFNSMLGESTEYMITVRHPVTSCISTYEKSGGLPAGGKFATRSAIEVWAARDYLFLAGDGEAPYLTEKDYFDIYLAFWERYHYNLALTGLAANKKWTIVPYSESAMVAAAQDIHSRFGHSAKPEAFRVFDKRDRHPDWHARAEKSIGRVRDVWTSVGIEFPTEEIMEAW